MTLRLLLTCALLVSLFSSSFAQKKYKQQRFLAGVYLGGNFSQMDGDKYQGYSKKGITGGLKGMALLGERTYLSVGLSYSQRGSKSKRESSRVTNVSNRKPLDISLGYAEAPILIHILVKPDETGFYKFNLHAGFSYSRLISSKVEEPNSSVFNPKELDFSGIIDEFNRNDIALLAGVTFNMNKHFGLSLRHYISVTPLFKANPDINKEIVSDLVPYWLSALLQYHF